MSAETFDSYASRIIAQEAARIYRKAVEASAERGECKDCKAFHVDLGETMRMVCGGLHNSKAIRNELVSGACPFKDGAGYVQAGR